MKDTRRTPFPVPPARRRATALAALAATVLALPRDVPAGPAPGEPALAGLRAGMTLPDAVVLLDAWGVPWLEGEPRPFDRAGGGTVEGRVLRLGPARDTPLGPLEGGSLLFLAGRLFWVDLALDAGLWRSRAPSLLGRPAVRLPRSRLWAWPSRRTGAWATARDGGHDLTVAFYGTALETGMMSEEEYGRALADLLDDLRAHGLRTNDEAPGPAARR